MYRAEGGLFQAEAIHARVPAALRMFQKLKGSQCSWREGTAGRGRQDHDPNNLAVSSGSHRVCFSSHRPCLHREPWAPCASMSKMLAECDTCP